MASLVREKNCLFFFFTEFCFICGCDHANFKYDQEFDSVHLVSKKDYNSCNPNNPIHKMDDGDSTFVFNKSGPFFFISGNVGNCQHGQKLIVVVLALTHHQHSHSPFFTTAQHHQKYRLWRKRRHLQQWICCLLGQMWPHLARIVWHRLQQSIRDLLRLGFGLVLLWVLALGWVCSSASRASLLVTVPS